MKKLLIGILLFTTLIWAKEIDINKAKGISQDVIASLNPMPAQINVSQDIVIKTVFNVALNPKSIQKNEITLKDITQTKKRSIGGDITYNAEEKSLTFTPTQSLQEGYYEISIKSLRTIGEEKDTHIGGIQYRFFVIEQEIVNGYVLPPEPDPAVNNATLLGVDSNDNGVRDDVERKIIIKYVKPIEIELMLAYTKTHQEMLNDPVGLAIESEKSMTRIIDCRMYLKRQGIRVNSIVNFTENNMYNTKQRVKAYLEFNKALGSGVYGTSPSNWNAQACDFDVAQMLKDRK